MSKITINFVGGPWHGKSREEDALWEHEHPTWVVEDLRDDVMHPHRWLYHSLGWRWMFWPATITYVPRGFSVMQAGQRVVIDDRFKEDPEYVALAMDKARRILQHHLDEHLYETPPLSPIIREERTSDDETLGVPTTFFTVKAFWIYEEPQRPSWT
jgi:hypothetical protein